jgi:hypothetical protein
MATIGNLNPTLADVAKRLDPKGKIDVIVELLKETNPILDDMTMVECNDGSGHQTTVRTGLPAVAWRLLNHGVQPSKSRTAQVKDTCGMLSGYAEVDKKLADKNGNTAEFRLSEDRAFIEAMNQQMAETLFYGDTRKNPERFLGLAPRYSALSGSESAANVLSAGGNANNTSVWLCTWSPNTLHGLYPEGSKAGFQHNDLGEVTLEDENGGKYQGYRSHYGWDLGLCLRDWRYCVRISNINTGTLTKNAATGADLVDLMVQALELLPAQNMGRTVFYCNRTIRSFLRRQITNKNNVHLSLEEIAGKKVVAFDGLPVQAVDAITNAEDTVA